MANGEVLKAFIVEHKVYFNETNAVGGVAYFSNFVKWQGMAREEYFVETVPDWRAIMELISIGKLNMITVEEHSHFIQHAFFGNQITIQLYTTNIKRYSFDMVFFMFNEEKKLLYEGLQRLAFDDFKGKFMEIPDSMLKSVKEREINLADLKLTKLNRYLKL